MAAAYATPGADPYYYDPAVQPVAYAAPPPAGRTSKYNTTPKARIAAVLLVISIILCIIAHFLQWSKPTNDDGGLGLWRVCTSVGTGTKECSNIKNAEPWLQVVRAFMICAPILMLLAIIFMIVDSPPIYICAQLCTSCAFGLLAFAVFYYPYREWKESKANKVDAGWILAIIAEFFCIVGSIVLFVATADGFAPPGSAKRYQTMPEALSGKTPPPTYTNAGPVYDPSANYGANPLTVPAASSTVPIASSSGYVTPPQTYAEPTAFPTAPPATQFDNLAYSDGEFGAAYYEQTPAVSTAGALQ